MAFGFFKKSEKADTIFHNAVLHSSTADVEGLDAVACREGKVMAFGNFENMSDLVGKETEVLDLGGKHLYPGFIGIHNKPVMSTFDGQYLDLSGCDTTEEVLEAVKAWREGHSDGEIVFGYGFPEKVVPLSDDDDDECGDNEREDDECGGHAEDRDHRDEDDDEDGEDCGDCHDDDSRKDDDDDQWDEEEQEEFDEEMETQETAYTDEGDLEIIYTKGNEVLSEAVDDVPVVLLCANCVNTWINKAATEIVQRTADDEVVQYITTDYILNIFLPIEPSAAEKLVYENSVRLAKKGCTTLLNTRTPDFFENLYIDALIGFYNEDMLKQRFYGSYLLNRQLVPKPLEYRLLTRQTKCVELEGLINSDTLYIDLDNGNSERPFEKDILCEILEVICNRGITLFFGAKSKDDLVFAYDCVEQLRSRGYNNAIMIASDCALEQSEQADYIYFDSALKTWAVTSETPPAGDEGIEGGDLLDCLTLDFAEFLNSDVPLGVLAIDGAADFAVYDGDISELTYGQLCAKDAAMTVLGGKVVYDADRPELCEYQPVADMWAEADEAEDEPEYED